MLLIMQTRGFVGVIVGVAALIGCSSPPLQPVLNNQRHRLAIVASSDSRPEFKLLTAQFIAIVTKYLDGNFVEMVERYPTDTENKIRTYQNPFRLFPHDTAQPVPFIVHSSLTSIHTERVHYHPFGFDIPVSATAIPWPNWMTSTSVHYRFSISVSDAIIDSFEVVGRSVGLEKSAKRDTLAMEANSVAAYNFAGMLAKRLNELYNWNIRSKLSYLTQEKLERIKNLYRVE
jgi:hypothetical protein